MIGYRDSLSARQHWCFIARHCALYPVNPPITLKSMRLRNVRRVSYSWTECALLTTLVLWWPVILRMWNKVQPQVRSNGVEKESASLTGGRKYLPVLLGGKRWMWTKRCYARAWSYGYVYVLKCCCIRLRITTPVFRSKEVVFTCLR